MFKTKRIRICIGSIYYRQPNKQLVIMVLQRHASSHTSHRQVRSEPYGLSSIITYSSGGCCSV
jgi:hypothetical protein